LMCPAGDGRRNPNLRGMPLQGSVYRAKSAL
jgi:hypothetical protein